MSSKSCHFGTINKPYSRVLDLLVCLALFTGILAVPSLVSIVEAADAKASNKDSNKDSVGPNDNPYPEQWSECYTSNAMPNDLGQLPSFLGGGDGGLWENWSVGATPSVKLLQYTFGNHQAVSFDPSVGMGVSFRYYGNSSLQIDESAGTIDAMQTEEHDFDSKYVDKSEDEKAKDEEYQKKKKSYLDRRKGFTYAQLENFRQAYGPDETKMLSRKKFVLPLTHIQSKCRRSTTARLFGEGANNRIFLANSMFSITPIIYVKNPTSVGHTSTLTVQPAIVAGFFQDIINVGVGFNLTGPDTGKIFLLVSLGYGIQF